MTHHTDMANDIRTEWVEASEIRAGDRLARRNSCGGFVEWLRVTAALDAYGCIECGAGGTVAIPGRQFEIEARA